MKKFKDILNQVLFAKIFAQSFDVKFFSKPKFCGDPGLRFKR